MSLSDKRNKEKIAIVVVGYNRLSAMQRLLTSLKNAIYSKEEVPLYISIDASGDNNLYEYVKSFEWHFGEKYINIQKERLGLKKHILQCGDLTDYFKAIVMLEDDLFVSPYFYDYVLNSVEFYGDEDRIGGISLYPKEMGFYGYPRIYMEDGSDTFLMQSPASWGQCWTEKQWKEFRGWLISFKEADFDKIDIPIFAKKWKAAWTKYFQAYLVETNRYFVYPYKSLTTCFGDVGTHSTSISTFGQNSLIMGEKKYFFRKFEEMVKYDIFDINESVYDWVGLPKEELYIDFYGYNQNTRNCRYLLTPAKLKLPIVKSFGLYMRPIELNVKYCIEGNALFLYDNGNSREKISDYRLPSSVASYFLRGFDLRTMTLYSFSRSIQLLKAKLLRR